MTTTLFPLKAFRLRRFVIAASLLTFGFGLGSAQAYVISNKMAKAAADEIMSATASNRSNVAATVGQTYTAGTGASDAAENAAKIVKYLPEKEQRYLAGRVGVGVAVNYPSQLSVITYKLVTLNENTRENSAMIVYQAALAGDISQADELAFGMNLAILKHKDVAKQSYYITDSIMSAVTNRTTSSVSDRINELALVAANLSAGLSSPNKCGVISKDHKTSLTIIAYELSKYISQLSSDSTTVAAAYKLFANTLTSITGANSSSTIRTAVNYVLQSIVLPTVQQSTNSNVSNAVSQVINSVVNGTGGSTTTTGNVTTPETLTVDPNRT